jgi:hypothetical protein
MSACHAIITLINRRCLAIVATYIALSHQTHSPHHDKQAHMQGAVTMMMTVAYTLRRYAGTRERCFGASRARSEAERKGMRV